MEMKGEQLIPAPQQAVWDALNDPGVLKACVPGCESLEKSGDNEYQVLMVARVGPVSAKFKGRLTLSDINPPSSYSISFEGQGGAAGFAKGSAQVDRKSTRLNSSHLVISYAVFCLKKKNLRLRHRHHDHEQSVRQPFGASRSLPSAGRLDLAQAPRHTDVHPRVSGSTDGLSQRLM